MNILILDDNELGSRYIRDKVEARRSGVTHVHLATRAEKAYALAEQAVARGEPFDALIIDFRLGPGDDGLTVMRRLQEISPDSETILFTGGSDAEIGIEALRSGAIDYFDQGSLNVDELLQRLDWIDGLQRLDRATQEAINAPDTNGLLITIAENALRFGFKRARLWRVIFDGNGKPTGFRGVRQIGNEGLDDFSGVEMPVSEAIHARILLERTSSVLGPKEGPEDSYLARTHPEYQIPVGTLYGLSLRWGGQSRAILMLDHGPTPDYVQPSFQPRLLHRFVTSASAALARAESAEEAHGFREFAGRIENSMAGGQTLEASLELVYGEVCSRIPDVKERCVFKIAVKDLRANTADYVYFRHLGQKQPTYRRNLKDRRAVATLLRTNVTSSIMLNGPEENAAFRQKHQVDQGMPHLGFVFAPMVVGGTVTGALILESSEESAFRFLPWHRDTLARIAREAGASIEAGRLYKQAQTDSQRKATLLQARVYVDLWTRLGRESQEIWQMVLTAITMEKGIGLNRALLFARDDGGGFGLLAGVGERNEREALGKWPSIPPFELRAWVEARAIADKTLILTELSAWEQTSLDAVNSQLEGSLLDQLRPGWNRLTKLDAQSLLPSGLRANSTFDDCAVCLIKIAEQLEVVLYVDNVGHHSPLIDDSLEDAMGLAVFTAQELQARQKKDTARRLLSLSNRDFPHETFLANLDEIAEAAVRFGGADLAIVYPVFPEGIPIPKDLADHAVVFGHKRDETLSRKKHEGGLTDTTLDREQIIMTSLAGSNVVLDNGQILQEHGLVRDEKLQAVISTAIAGEFSGEQFGVLILGYRRPIGNNEEHSQLAKSLARIAGRAIRAKWNHLKVRSELDDLKKVSRAEVGAHRQIMETSVSADARPEHVAAVAAERLRRLIEEGGAPPLTECRVYLRDWAAASNIDPAREIRVGFGDSEGDTNQQYKNSPTLGVIGRAMRTRGAEYVPNVATDPDYLRANLQTRSELAVPLLIREGATVRIIGCINVESSSDDALGGEHLQLVERFAPVVALAIDTAQRRERRSRLLEATQAIAESTDLHRVAQMIASRTLLIAEGASIVDVLYSDRVGFEVTRDRRAGFSPEGALAPTTLGVIARNLALANDQPRFLESLEIPLSDTGDEVQIQALAFLPLAAASADDPTRQPRGRARGIFVYYLQPHVFTEDEKLCLKELANSASAGLNQTNLTDELATETFVYTYTTLVFELAHSLGNHLPLAKLNAERLVENPQSTERLKWASDLRRQLEEIEQSLPASLGMANLDAHRFTHKEVHELVEDVIAKTRRKSDVEFDCASSERPFSAIVDPSQLRRALQHLVRNAAQERLGTKRISIQIVDSTNQDYSARILIEDDGVGFTDEQAQYVLRRPIVTASEDGRRHVGLGLLFAERHAKAMGARLQYLGKSSLGGAAFAIDLRQSET